MSRRSDTSRDLLFGLLALQTGLIQQSSLVNAFLGWTQNKDRAMADILVEAGSLDASDRAAIEGLVDRHLKKHGGDLEKSLIALGAGASTREKLAGLKDVDLNASLAGLGAPRNEDPQAGSQTDETLGPTPGSHMHGTDRYQIKRSHAKGGLGEVFIAIDNEINKRKVALKEIQLKYAHDQRYRDRFTLEAEVTGGLEHPGIVPVYSMGTYADNRPYYVMRFIEGDSLKDTIAAFHANALLKRDPGQRSIAFRELLRRFLDVCNAIEYAHDRGVLHRDLKPDNIMVGQYGETLVVDWGLARAAGKGTQKAGTAPGSEGQTFVPSSSGSSETQAGIAMGTPGYMSPEQAKGDSDHVGPCSDVYSLGATLYALLTGKSPFPQDNADVIFQAMIKGDFPKPRTLDSTIDAPLEAICLKAMAVTPGDRYHSAKALAEDLKGWLADEPVSAYPEPFSRRAQRWAKRHRTALTAGVATLVMALVGTGAVLAVQTQAKARLEAANIELNTANTALAASNEQVRVRFALAKDAIKLFHGEVSDDVLMKEKAFDGLRTKLLRGAADFYRRLETLLEGETDEASRQSLGDAQFDLAFLIDKIGDKAEALKVSGRALAIREKLAQENPTVIKYQNDLAASHNNLGALLSATGKNAEAREAYDQAILIKKKLAQENPTVTKYQNNLAASHNNLGALLASTGKNAEAREAYEQAIRIQKKLAEENPTVTKYQNNLANSYNNLGFLLHNTGKNDEAREACEQAIRIQKKLAQENPTVTEYQNILAGSHLNLGNLLRATGKNAEAREAYDQALLIRKRLAQENPTVTNYQNGLAGSHNNLGNLLAGTGKNAEAREAYDQAILIKKKLAQDNPTVTEYQSDLAMSHNNLGLLLAGTGKNAEAREAYDQAILIQKKLAQENPTVTEYQSNLANSHLNLGRLLADTGKPAEAILEFQEVIKIFQHLEIKGLRNDYDFACTLSLIGKLAEQSGSGVSVSEGKAKLDEAMTRLRRSLEVDRNMSMADVQTNHDLDPLRGRADFKLLMLDLMFPVEPFAR